MESITFAGERVYSNLTRAVVVVWLFVVLILTSSYTASLSSMLTVQRLQPVRDIEWLRSTNAKIGCDNDSFVMNYLQNVLQFNSTNIITVTTESDYEEHFKEKSIAAAFFELPYEKIFINKYCKGFTTSTQTYRFGGFGFVSSNYSFLSFSFHKILNWSSRSSIVLHISIGHQWIKFKRFMHFFRLHWSFWIRGRKCGFQTVWMWKETIL